MRSKRPNVTAADRESFAAMKTLVKQGWGADNPAFRQIFTSLSDATMQPCENPTEFLREGLGIKNGSPWRRAAAIHVWKEDCKQADRR